MRILHEGNTLVVCEDGREIMAIAENFIHGNMVATVSGKLADKEVVSIWEMELMTIGSLQKKGYIEMSEVEEAGEEVMYALLEIRDRMGETPTNLLLVNVPESMRKLPQYKRISGYYQIRDEDIYQKKESPDVNAALLKDNLSSYLTRNLFPEKEKLDTAMLKIGDSFQEYLLQMIDQKGFTDVQVYKNANLNRKLFSKIRCNREYLPKKKTAVALALALELNINETVDLLQRAELALSPGSKFDVIIRYCIENRIYNLLTVNELLYDYGQATL